MLRDHERRRNGKIRAEEKRRFFKRLDLALEAVSDIAETDWLIKETFTALLNLKGDFARRGYLVYEPETCMRGRPFGRVVRKHLEPVFRALPVLPIDLEDPQKYQTIARTIEEEFERSRELGEDWSPAQEIVGNLLIPVFQALADFYRHSLPEEKTGLCKFCFRLKRSGSEYCPLHTRAKPGCNEIGNVDRKGNRGRYVEALRKNPSEAFRRTKVLSHARFRLAGPDERILSGNIGRSWSSAREELARRLEKDTPHVFERIKKALSVSDWETAVKDMGIGLGDIPPPPWPVSGVLFWLRAAEAYFSSGFEKTSTKANRIRAMLARGAKQTDIARSVGTSRQLVNRIANGKRGK